jgi:VWFA-related protein
MKFLAPKPPRGPESRWTSPRSLFTCAVASALLLITAPFCLGQQSTRVETFNIGPNATVKVENYRGAVRAEVWEGQAVRIIAEKKEPKGQPILASDLMLMAANGDVVVKCNQTGTTDRIDLTIYVPRNAHIQITGGTYAVEVNGSLGSAVVQTTTGDIGCRLPPSAGARVAMHSARGVVRAALAINVDERVGLHTLQGTIGDGAVPIMLDSKSGNITLLPGAGIRHVASITDGQFSRPDASLAQPPATESSSADQSGPRASAADQDYSSPRRGGSGALNQDPDSVLIQPPSRSSRNVGGSAPPTNNEMVFGGSGGSTHGSSVTKLSGIPHPSQTDITSENSSGLKVRIIPADSTAGGAGDPRYPNQKNIDRLYAPDSNDQSAEPNGPDPSSGSGPQTPDSRLPGSRLPRDPGAQAAGSGLPTGGGGEVSLGGGGNSTKGSSVTKIAGVPHPGVTDITGENNMGLKVRIIPSGATAGGDGDPRYPEQKSYNRIYSDPDESTQATGTGRDASRQIPYRDSNGQSVSAPAGNSEPGDESRSGEPRPAPVDPMSAAAGRGPAPRPARAKATDSDAIVLTSSLVSMNVSVTDRAGKTLAGLKKEDFKIAENGEEQAVDFFAPSTAPFNLVLLLDLSGSITDKIEVVKSAALHFLDVVGPEDKVAVVTFTRDVTVISNLTNNRDLLRKRIKAIKKPEGGTAFYEAMWFTLVDTLRGTEGQRNAIVVMSDGVDNSLERFNPAHSRVSFDQLARRLQGSDCIMFPIYLDTEYEEVFERGNSSSESYAVARDQLAHIADITGGRLFQAQHPEDLAGVYNQVAEALRTVYSVGYYPTNGQRDGTFRRVSIGVDKAGVVVRSRKGYYAR